MKTALKFDFCFHIHIFFCLYSININRITYIGVIIWGLRILILIRKMPSFSLFLDEFGEDDHSS